jgi:hypothetical protein
VPPSSWLCATSALKKPFERSVEMVADDGGDREWTMPRAEGGSIDALNDQRFATTSNGAATPVTSRRPKFTHKRPRTMGTAA